MSPALLHLVTLCLSSILAVYVEGVLPRPLVHDTLSVTRLWTVVLFYKVRVTDEPRGHACSHFMLDIVVNK